MFVVLYGINNLGKSTQAKRLVEKFRTAGYEAEYLKYALYNLEPSGRLINEYLRKGNPQNFSPREFQILQVLNRYQYQPELIEKLKNGVHVIAEDYVGTGLAWGIGAGVDEEFLKYLNKDLLKEDLAFLFRGERFREATENGHRHEEDAALLEKVRLIHERLGQEQNWISIEANRPVEEITEELWQMCQQRLNN